MDLKNDRAAISEAFHDITNQQLAVKAQLNDLQARAARYRADAKMSGKEGIRTLSRLSEAERHLIAAIEALTSAHLSAEMDVERAGTPFECPDLVSAERRALSMRAEAA